MTEDRAVSLNAVIERIKNQYNEHNELIPKYVKLHIDHGLEQINYLFENRPQYTFFDFLVEYLGKGIDVIEDAPVPLDAVKNNNQHINKTTFTGPIDIKIGYNPKTQEPITFCFNNTKIYNNPSIFFLSSAEIPLKSKNKKFTCPCVLVTN